MRVYSDDQWFRLFTMKMSQVFGVRVGSSMQDSITPGENGDQVSVIGVVTPHECLNFT
jgi:hypothetical protein